MKPCCLTTKSIDKDACISSPRMGGKTGYTSGKCPMSADEASKMISQKKPKGCCYTIGYGDRMKPCCLTTQLTDKAACTSSDRPGGATGYTSGECPTSADEAKQMISKKNRTIKSVKPMKCTSQSCITASNINDANTSNDINDDNNNIITNNAKNAIGKFNNNTTDVINFSSTV